MDQNNSVKYSFNICMDVDSIEVLRPYWEKYQHSPNGDIDYLLMECAEGDGVQKPLVVSLQENGIPKVILVGRCGYAREAVRFGFRKIDSLRLKSFIVPSGGFLHEEEFNKPAIIINLLRMLVKSGDIDTVKINSIEYRSPLYQDFIKYTPAIMRGLVPFHQFTWRLGVNLSYNQFLGRHRNYKKTQRYILNKLSQSFNGDYDIYKFSGANDIDKVFEDMRSISIKSWQQKTGEGLALSIPQRRKIEHYGRRNQLVSYILKIQGVPVAYWYGFLYKKVLFLEGTAFDPNFRRNSVGTNLLMKLIDDAFSNPDIDYLDFGAGNDQGKSLYCDITKEIVCINLYARSLLPVSANLFKSSVELVHQNVRDILKRLTLDGRLRKKSRQCL